MKRGNVCAIHEEFSPDGECRWCEPPPSVVPERSFAEAARARIEAMKEMARKGMIYGTGIINTQWDPLLQQRQAQQGLGASPLNVMPPLPIANCAHDGVLFDFNGVTSYAACGKVLVPAIPVVLHYAGCGSLVGTACTCGHP